MPHKGNEAAMKTHEPEDPLELVGVQMKEGPDEQALAEMAGCFIEEYARMGWSGERILRLFRNSFYRGPNQILRAKGEEFVRERIEAITGVKAGPTPSRGD
jgi:hypothetical protein